MSNYSAENIQAVVNGEQIEPTKATSRVHVGTISVFDSVFDLDQKYDIFSEHVAVTDEEAEALERYLVKEVNHLLVEKDASHDEFISAINKAIEGSGLAPKVVVEEAK